MITIKVKEVLETQQKTSKAGKQYTVSSFKGDDEKLYKDVYGSFTVGQEVTGEWKETEYGLKFEVSRPVRAFGGGRSPEETRSIIRQHSQGVAIQFVALLDNTKRGPEDLLKLVFSIADKFEQDASSKVTVATAPAQPPLAMPKVIKTKEDVAALIKSEHEQIAADMEEIPF